MADNLHLNIGALRSAMELTLHTHQAARIWRGRAPAEGRPGIIGLSGFASVMSRMKRGSEQDDPYSDWWMIRVEEKLDDTKQQLRVLRDQVDQVLATVSPSLTLGENLNVQPAKLPIFVNAQLGFLAVYLLVDFDDVARRLILAHHTALIDRRTLDLWLDEGSHHLRSTFSLAQRYKFSGATRDDFAANNAAARQARERFGELPADVLDGSRRSRFAPPIIRRSALAQLGAPAPAQTPDPVGDDSGDVPDTDTPGADFPDSELGEDSSP